MVGAFREEVRDNKKDLVHSFIHSKMFIVLLSCARLWGLLIKGGPGIANQRRCGEKSG